VTCWRPVLSHWRSTSVPCGVTLTKKADSMVQPTLVISALFGCVSAGIYAYVGWRLRQRVIASADGRLAWTLLRVWWFGLAGTTLSTALLSLLGAVGVTSLPVFIGLTYLNLLLICVALWGLLYYLVYLFTGSRRWLWPLSLFYIAYAAMLLYYITASGPIRVQAGRWSTTIVYQATPTGPVVIFILALLVFPQIIGALAYFTLYFRVKEARQKYRILLVSWSIILWFGSAFAASAAGLAQYDWWQIVSRVIGLGAAFAILIAYLPPAWLKQRLGLIAISDQASA